MSELALKVEFWPAFIQNATFEISGKSLRFEAATVINEEDFRYEKQMKSSTVSEFIKDCESLLIKAKSEEEKLGFDGVTVIGKLINTNGKEIEFDFWSPDKKSDYMKLAKSIFSLIDENHLSVELKTYFNELQSYFNG